MQPRTISRYILPLFLALLVAGGLGWVWFGGSAERAPDVAFETLDGERVALADLRDDPVIVYFWATDCASCMQEMPDLVELYEELRAEGLEFVAVAMAHDDPDAVRRLAENRQLPFDIVLDREGAYARAFGNVRVTPTKYLIDGDGRIQLRHIGTTDYAALRERVRALL